MDPSKDSIVSLTTVTQLAHLELDRQQKDLLKLAGRIERMETQLANLKLDYRGWSDSIVSEREEVRKLATAASLNRSEPPQEKPIVQLDTLRELVNDGQKLKAIQLFRESRLTLLDAKNFVESLVK